MRMEDVSPALQERLGPHATIGLLTLLDTLRQEWTADVMNLTGDRFERRLTEEVAGLRTAIVEGDAALRVEFKQESAQLRIEMRELRSELKQEMSGLRTELKQDMSGLRMELRQEMSALGAGLTREMTELRLGLMDGMSTLGSKVDQSILRMTRWTFLMWAGQLVAIAAIMSAMFQIYAE